jgi:CRP-like cAMP-binding protein
MSLEDEVDLLRKIPIFARIDPAKLKLLAFTSERISFDEGQTLFNQGDQSDAAYVIIAGSADVLVDTVSGKISVAHLGRNALVGEIGILCDVPRTATVKALTELETLKVEKLNFFRLIEEFPQMATEVVRELAARLARTTSDLIETRNELAATKR